MKKNKLATLLFLLAAALCILFAFRNSMQNGSDSHTRSTLLLQWLQSHFRHLGFLSEYRLRKLAHIFEYTVLSFFLANFWHQIALDHKRRVTLFLLTALPIPYIDEMIQLTSDGRESKFQDVLIDCLGLGLGALLALGIFLLTYLISRKKSHPSESSNSSSFFCNRACGYFPCHPTEHPEDFNCLFCYCPLYALGDRCGGAFSYNAKGYKDCTKCSFPHHRENYAKILARYPEIAEIAKKHQN